jgi:16S rRNA (guanine527-N7)-methyltransferase
MEALHRLAESHGLDPAQEEALAAYVGAVLAWRGGNVTGLGSADDIAGTLVGDSLALLGLPELQAAQAPGASWLDLGSGGGVPGIPLAVALPEVRITLLESIARKCAFLREAVAAAGAGDRVTVECARSERYAAGPPGREAHGLVVARAVGPLATVVELAAPLLAPGGRLLVPTGEERAASELAAGEAAAARCGLRIERVAALSESPVPRSVCVVAARSGDVPAWLPRREGRARTHPLA